MRQLTKSQDRKLLGVAAGLAEYFDMDKTMMRAIWIIGCIVMPPLVLAYFVMGMVLPDPGAAPRRQAAPPGPNPGPNPGPSPGSNPGPNPGPSPGPNPGASRRRLTKSYDRWVSGVAGGLAEYFDVDPLLIRALFVAAFFGFGTGLLAYIVLAIVMPRPESY